MSTTWTPDGNVADWLAAVMLETAEALGQKVGEGRYRAYAADLDGYDPAAVVAAFRRARRETKFFPSVAEIRAQIEPVGDDPGVLAWAGLLDAASRVGAYQALDVDDPATAAALVRSVGSWPEFCALSPGPEMATRRTEFLAAYRDARRSQSTDAGATRLPGLLGGPNHPALWAGRLTIDNAVVNARPALAGRGDVRRLTDGARDGEATEESGPSGDGRPRDPAAAQGRRGVRRDPRRADGAQREGGRGEG